MKSVRKLVKSVRIGKAAIAVAAALVLFGLVGCSGGSADSGSSKSTSVVIDTSFDIATVDPGRSFDPTGTTVNHALYESLLTFKGSDVSKPVDGLASYVLSDQDKVMTLTMKDGAKFSDGTPVTVDDAVFSLQRVQGIAGNPSFLLQDVKIEKTSDKTLTLTSPIPNPTLAYILPNPSLGILNSKVVKENGGTTDKNDQAESFLNKTSAGAGPYMLESFDATSRIVLKANPYYNGPKPAKSRVVLRNVVAETQSLNIQSGDSQVALDLNPDQVKQLNQALFNIESTPSRTTVYIMLNQDPKVSKITSNPKFDTAVKFALDYDKILALAGAGAQRPGGVVPSQFVGALPTAKGNQYNLDAAKQALKDSGYNGEQVTMQYANDVTTSGMLMQPFAETIQSQLKAAGINITLAPGPEATVLSKYRGGKEEMGIWGWGADYPDPQDYLVYLPGENLGLRAMWLKGVNSGIDALSAKAKTASGEQARSDAYQALQMALNEKGPFISLFQPVANIVTTKAINSFDSNVVWTIDIASIK